MTALFPQTPPSKGKKHTGKGSITATTVRAASRFTTKTAMEDSHVPLNQWVCAFREFMASKNGVSAHQLHRTCQCGQHRPHRAGQCRQGRHDRHGRGEPQPAQSRLLPRHRQLAGGMGQRRVPHQRWRTLFLALQAFGDAHISARCTCIAIWPSSISDTAIASNLALIIHYARIAPCAASKEEAYLSADRSATIRSMRRGQARATHAARTVPSRDADRKPASVPSTKELLTIVLCRITDKSILIRSAVRC
jgi:hypothetical protein